MPGDDVLSATGGVQSDVHDSDYYVIGYYSSNRDASNRTRQVEIIVSRPDLRLEYQTRYSIRPGR